MDKKSLFHQVHKSFMEDPLSRFIKTLSFSPTAFGHQQDDPDAQTDDRVIGDYEIIYVIGGESRIQIMDKLYICGAGDVIIIPPYTVHSIHTTAHNPHHNYWMHFDIQPVYLQSEFHNAFMLDKTHCHSIGIHEDMLMLYRFLEKQKQKSSEGQIILFETILQQIVTIVLSQLSLQEGSKHFNLMGMGHPIHSSDRELVDKSMAIINQNIFDKLNVSDVCNKLHISESYLYKVFKRVMKLTPSFYIQLSKVKRAELMLKSTSLSIKEISESLSYPSQYHFSNVFKKFYSVSPREYRRGM